MTHDEFNLDHFSSDPIVQRNDASAAPVQQFLREQFFRHGSPEALLREHPRDRAIWATADCTSYNEYQRQGILAEKILHMILARMKACMRNDPQTTSSLLSPMTHREDHNETYDLVRGWVHSYLRLVISSTNFQIFRPEPCETWQYEPPYRNECEFDAVAIYRQQDNQDTAILFDVSTTLGLRKMGRFRNRIVRITGMPSKLQMFGIRFSSRSMDDLDDIYSIELGNPRTLHLDLRIQRAASTTLNDPLHDRYDVFRKSLDGFVKNKTLVN